MRPFICVFYFTVLLFSLPSCTSDDEIVTPDPVIPSPSSLVVFEPDSLPYASLSDYNFFEGELKDLAPVEGVLQYDLITPLFSDYAKKKRFIWMMAGSSASYDADQKVLNFDNGTVLIKNFYYDNVLPDLERRIVETRLLYRIDDNWHFAEYVWNEEQTEATLDLSGGYTDVTWIEEGEERTVNYRIPSELECLTCHKSGTTAIPLGPKPQNIDRVISYEEGVRNQIDKWAEMGYLSGIIPSEIDRVAAWDDPNELLENRVRAYVDVNCSSCHLEGSHCDYRAIRLAWNETADLSNLGLCMEPDEIVGPALLYVILPGNIDRSVLHHRMASTDEAVRMPLLGRTLVHKEAVELISTYILSLEDPCE